MKKVLMGICSVLPGGFFFLGVMMLLVGCARLQYQAEATKVNGFTTTPEAAMMVSAEAEAVRADAEATRRCANEPGKCRAMELARGWYGNGWLDLPEGYTLAGIQAATAASSVMPPAQQSAPKQPTTPKQPTAKPQAAPELGKKTESAAPVTEPSAKTFRSQRIRIPEWVD